MLSPRGQEALKHYQNQMAPAERKLPFSNMGYRELVTLAEALQDGTLERIIDLELIARVSQ